MPTRQKKLGWAAHTLLRNRRRLAVHQLGEARIILGVAFLIGPWVGAGLVKGLSLGGPRADVLTVNRREERWICQWLLVFTLMTLELGLVPLPLYARNR